MVDFGGFLAYVDIDSGDMSKYLSARFSRPKSTQNLLTVQLPSASFLTGMVGIETYLALIDFTMMPASLIFPHVSARTARSMGERRREAQKKAL